MQELGFKVPLQLLLSWGSIAPAAMAKAECSAWENIACLACCRHCTRKSMHDVLNTGTYTFSWSHASMLFCCDSYAWLCSCASIHHPIDKSGTVQEMS